MFRVFFRQEGFRRVYLPVDAEGVVLNGDAAVGFGMIVIVTFVLEHRCIGEYGKSVGETSRYEELPRAVRMWVNPCGCLLPRQVLSPSRNARVSPVRMAVAGSGARA